MTPTVINMVQGDAGPPRTFTLIREDNSIVDLSDASKVVFDIYEPNSHTQTNSTTNSCTILSPPSSGKVLYNWDATDLPQVGLCLAKLVVTYNSGGSPETVIVNIAVEADPAID